MSSLIFKIARYKYHSKKEKFQYYSKGKLKSTFQLKRIPQKLLYKKGIFHINCYFSDFQHAVIDKVSAGELITTQKKHNSKA